MLAVWAVVVTALPLCSILAVPLLDLIEITVSDADNPIREYDHLQETMVVTMGDINTNPHRNAIANTNMKWPRGEVPYVISQLYTTNIQNSIVAAMRELEQDVNGAANVCVTFIPRTNQTNYINIYPGRGCRTSIGMLNTGKQDLSLGRGCEAKGVIMHELIHVLGFWHEHNRPDRDTYININLTNVNDNNKGDFIKATAAMLDTLNTPYDLGSIMHYGPYSQAKDKTIPVITPKPDQAGDIKLGQRMALSTWDVVRIQRWYGCTEDTSHISRPFLTDSVARCDFANGTCNLTQTTSSGLGWTVMEGSSGAGPRAGNTNGLDAYLVAREVSNNGTARVLTPLFSVGAVCVTLFRFQRGPSSYLRLIASGPSIAPMVVATFEGNNVNEWRPARLNINAPVGAAFQITFEANMSFGDVAIDDVNIYKGPCV